jgi:hypothetical protein
MVVAVVAGRQPFVRDYPEWASGSTR